MNTRTSLIAVTSLTATFVALCAAVFSVTGIAKLFAGATLSVLIMASALELGKIVSISFLYQYWKEIPRLLKWYLTTAATVLMIITSMGIYGFLTAAYQTTADQLSVTAKQTEVIELKRNRVAEDLATSLQDRDKLSSTIQELSRGLANNVVQYRDATTGQIVTTTSAATRQALEKQLQNATDERNRLANKMDKLTDSITALDMQVLNVAMTNELAAEIGPLRFIAELTGVEVNQVVNLFALLIVFVFDPLAVALVIAVNFLLKNKAPDPQPSPHPISAVPTPVETPAPVTEVPPEVDQMYAVYGDEITEEPSSVTLYSHDPQYFARGDFDWSNEKTWKDNPVAVDYYNTNIKPRLRGS
jgi:hypothetical protein